MRLNARTIIFDFMGTIVIAILLSLLVRTYVAEARWIPSESMLPTLKVGDRLIIDKISFKINGVERGDIVVFNIPETADNDEKVLIKRVIGLPGETISVKSGIVYINERSLNEPYIFEKPKDDFGPYVIPDDSLFVMGDNRNKSYDSRYWGPLPISNLIGKAEVRYYPLKEIGTLSHP